MKKQVLRWLALIGNLSLTHLHLAAYRPTNHIHTKSYENVWILFLNVKAKLYQLLDTCPKPVLRIRIRCFLHPGSGIRHEFFPDPGFQIPDLAPFFGGIYLQYLQNLCYVIFIKLGYS
jgi:hypothetical protein